MTILILVLRAYGSNVVAFFNCIIYYNNYLKAVRQYFAVAMILADQNHMIQLLQYNNIAMYELLPNPSCATLATSRQTRGSGYNRKHTIASIEEYIYC